MSQDIFSAERFVGWFVAVRDWFLSEVLSFETFVQAPILLLAALLAVVGARLPRARLERHAREGRDAWPAYLLPLWRGCGFPLLFAVLLWLSDGIAVQFGWHQGLVRIAASLASAWFAIRLVTVLAGETPWTRFIGYLVWLLAALAILDLLEPTTVFLDSVSVTFGELRLSALGLVKGLMVLAIFLWLGRGAGRLIERRLKRSAELTPSLQVLIAKLVQIAIVVIAFLIAINAMGIDLMGLAIFGGALGVGLGFGLQKIVANFVSGILLLMDKSIKPGDVIETGETYGWINQLTARYVSVITRDGTEHLIPNEYLVANPVINWTHSHKYVRLKTPIGISYDSDPRKAIELALEAARAHPRVVEDPVPVCFIVGFGASAIDLELRFWIQDPQEGIVNVRGTVLLDIWDKFREHGIKIPYPQRDLHIRSTEPVPVRVSSESEPPRGG